MNPLFGQGQAGDLSLDSNSSSHQGFWGEILMVLPRILA